MDYKRIIKSRSLRLKILSFFSFIPDKPMLMFQYWAKTGRKLNLKQPKRFTEKLQWYKLYYKNPLLIQCVDKYDVRDYVKSKGLEGILIPSYGIYNSPNDIKWETMPEQFVMKDTLGGGGTSVVIVKHKDNIDNLKRISETWIRKNENVAKGGGREWPYYTGKGHRIIIEKLVDSDDLSGGLIDYKFFCFGGKVEFIYVMGDRALGQSVKVSIYDRAFKKLPVRRVGDEEFTKAQKPLNYDRMIQVAEILSADFPHVRVDLYNVKGEIFFGELTFYNASGYMEYDPDSFDEEIGEKFTLYEYKGKEV